MSTVKIPPYEECVKNLNGFIQTLMKNPSEILFLDFMMNSKKPYVKTMFGKWEFAAEKETYYVLPEDDEHFFANEHFAYVYRDTHLKALIDVVDPNKISPLNDSFDASALHKNEVYIGNHLDFSIRHYTRQQNKVRVIYSHVTKYIIDANGRAFRDTQVQANFTLEQVHGNFVDSVEDFERTNHEVGRGLKTGLSIDMIFDQDKEWLLPLFNLTRVCLGLSQKGGAKRKYHEHNNKKCLVRKGPKEGEYIIVDKKRKYLKKQSGGGTNMESMIMSEMFSDLLYDMFVFPMIDKKCIEGMQVIFDYGQELTEYKDNLHLVLMYQYESRQKDDIFVIDGDTFLNAIEEKNNMTISVRPNLDKVAEMSERCKSMLRVIPNKSMSIETMEQ